MNRRELLATVGAVAGTASLGGCLSEYQEVADEVGETTTDGGTTERKTTGTTTGGDSSETTTEPTTTESDSTTTEADPTTTETVSGQEVTLTDTSFEVLDAGCGQPTNEASVDFSAETTVGVSGSLTGSNACYTAELVDASYDAEADALVVTVAATEEEGVEVCADCISEITYEASVAFEGGLPGTVEVVHEAMNETTTVATAESN